MAKSDALSCMSLELLVSSVSKVSRPFGFCDSQCGEEGSYHSRDEAEMTLVTARAQLCRQAMDLT